MMGRPGLSLAQKQALWMRWREGASCSEIARDLGKHPASVWGVLASRGGIAPAPRTRSPRTLTLHEREEISRGLAGSLSLSEIARRLGRPTSTVSREVRRHGGIKGVSRDVGR